MNNVSVDGALPFYCYYIGPITPSTNKQPQNHDHKKNPYIPNIDHNPIHEPSSEDMYWPELPNTPNGNRIWIDLGKIYC